jgi:PBP1b-binding outer membrane lipoprotein LpoB
MKSLFSLLALTLLLSGCVYLEDAYYADREYGAASQDAFDRQIVNKDFKYANRAPDGLDGLHAESAMQSYHSTFSESFSRENIDVSTTGN